MPSPGGALRVWRGASGNRGAIGHGLARNPAPWQMNVRLPLPPERHSGPPAACLASIACTTTSAFLVFLTRFRRRAAGIPQPVASLQLGPLGGAPIAKAGRAEVPSRPATGSWLPATWVVGEARAVCNSCASGSQIEALFRATEVISFCFISISALFSFVCRPKGCDIRLHRPAAAHSVPRSSRRDRACPPPSRPARLDGPRIPQPRRAPDALAVATLSLSRTIHHQDHKGHEAHEEQRS